AYSESNPAEYYSLDEVDDGKPNNITFSNPTIPAIETEFQIERLTNEDDLNRDGTDEIGFFTRAVSRFGMYCVYSLRGGKWKEIVNLYTHDSFYGEENGNAPDLVRIDPDRKGYVIIRTIEWDDEISWYKEIEKSVKIK
ncbi:MAG: VCBS repeat-containing protein, partial [Alistipes sp.]